MRGSIDSEFVGIPAMLGVGLSPAIHERALPRSAVRRRLEILSMVKALCDLDALHRTRDRRQLATVVEDGALHITSATAASPGPRRTQSSIEPRVSCSTFVTSIVTFDTSRRNASGSDRADEEGNIESICNSQHPAGRSEPMLVLLVQPR